MRGHWVCCDALPLQTEQCKKPERKTACCPQRRGKNAGECLAARTHVCRSRIRLITLFVVSSEYKTPTIENSANDCFFAPAIRFGRMPQAEKLKLKAESKMVEKEETSPMLADHKILVRQIHEAYMKNFNMNKAKARLILTGKTSKPVKKKKRREV